MKFGTGAVKITPAHDENDYKIGKAHNLPSIQVIDYNGKMTKQTGPDFSGLTTKKTREKVI